MLQRQTLIRSYNTYMCTAFQGYDVLDSTVKPNLKTSAAFFIYFDFVFVHMVSLFMSKTFFLYKKECLVDSMAL